MAALYSVKVEDQLPCMPALLHRIFSPSGALKPNRDTQKPTIDHMNQGKKRKPSLRWQTE
jgi:hypothetical protein